MLRGTRYFSVIHYACKSCLPLVTCRNCNLYVGTSPAVCSNTINVPYSSCSFSYVRSSGNSGSLTDTITIYPSDTVSYSGRNLLVAVRSDP